MSTEEILTLASEHKRLREACEGVIQAELNATVDSIPFPVERAIRHLRQVFLEDQSPGPKTAHRAAGVS